MIGKQVDYMSANCVKKQRSFDSELHEKLKIVRVKFTDSGPGIEAENIDRVFDPFFTTKKQGEGTGLGLAVIYGLIKANNGNITVDSESGKGATFKITLPVSM